MLRIAQSSDARRAEMCEVGKSRRSARSFFCAQGPNNPIQFADLGKHLDGKHVTVQFQVDKVYGTSQRYIPGQALKFGISAMSNDPKKKRLKRKRLNVWIGGELSEILNHLQMRSYQANRLKKGTRIQVTGKLEYRAAGRDAFELSLT